MYISWGNKHYWLNIRLGSRERLTPLCEFHFGHFSRLDCWWFPNQFWIVEPENAKRPIEFPDKVNPAWIPISKTFLKALSWTWHSLKNISCFWENMKWENLKHFTFKVSFWNIIFYITFPIIARLKLLCKFDTVCQLCKNMKPFNGCNTAKQLNVNLWKLFDEITI